MSRFKILCEYEGTRYSGWQIQRNARTVQGEIENAIHKVFGKKEFEFYGAGRTDAGVHALAQAAHLDVETVLAPEIIRMKLNDELPADISIIEVEKAPRSFHARHDAVARSYLYQISRRRTALGKRFVWWIKDELNVTAMRDCARLFVGMKDFRSFTADEPEEKSTKVLLHEVTITEADSLILIRITGSHFLWKMVRQMTGILAEVGRGAMNVADVSRLLATHSPIPAKTTAPPSGLFLERVYYRSERHTEPPLAVLRVLSLR